MGRIHSLLWNYSNATQRYRNWHHVSAVLARVEVGSRHEAAEIARQQLPLDSTK